MIWMNVYMCLQQKFGIMAINFAVVRIILTYRLGDIVQSSGKHKLINLKPLKMLGISGNFQKMCREVQKSWIFSGIQMSIALCIYLHAKRSFHMKLYTFKLINTMKTILFTIYKESACIFCSNKKKNSMPKYYWTESKSWFAAFTQMCYWLL